MKKKLLTLAAIVVAVSTIYLIWFSPSLQNLADKVNVNIETVQLSAENETIVTHVSARIVNGFDVGARVEDIRVSYGDLFIHLDPSSITVPAHSSSLYDFEAVISGGSGDCLSSIISDVLDDGVVRVTVECHVAPDSPVIPCFDYGREISISLNQFRNLPRIDKIDHIDVYSNVIYAYVHVFNPLPLTLSLSDLSYIGLCDGDVVFRGYMDSVSIPAGSDTLVRLPITEVGCIEHLFHPSTITCLLNTDLSIGSLNGFIRWRLDYRSEFSLNVSLDGDLKWLHKMDEYTIAPVVRIWGSTGFRNLNMYSLNILKGTGQLYWNDKYLSDIEVISSPRYGSPTIRIEDGNITGLVTFRITLPKPAEQWLTEQVNRTITASFRNLRATIQVLSKNITINIKEITRTFSTHVRYIPPPELVVKGEYLVIVQCKVYSELPWKILITKIQGEAWYMCPIGNLSFAYSISTNIGISCGENIFEVKCSVEENTDIPEKYGLHVFPSDIYSPVHILVKYVKIEFFGISLTVVINRVYILKLE